MTPSENPHAGMESAVDALLAPEPSAPITEPVTEPATTTPEPVAPATETPEKIEPPAPPVTSPEAKPAAEPAKAEEPVVEEDNLDDTDLDEAMKEGATAPNPLDLKSSRGKRIYQSYKAYKALDEAVGAEDLTVERVTQMRDAFVDNEAMVYEFSSGDPARAQNFVKFWNQTSPEGMVKVAANLPDTLAQVNPQAYMQMAVPVLNRYASALYTRSQVETNPELKQAFAYAARMLDWDLNNKFKSDDDLKAAPQAQPDPRAAEVSRQYNEIQRFQQAQTETTRTSWINALDEANSRMLETESDKVLAPLKAAYPSEKLYSAARREFIEAVIAQVAKDPSGETAYAISRNRALARMSSEDIPQLSKQYQNRASRVIRSLAPGFLKEAGVAAKSQSDARNSQLATAAKAGSAPSGGGKPTPQSIVPDARRFASKGEEMDAKIDELFRS